MRIALYEITQSRKKFLIENQSIAAGMRGNDSGAFVERDPESFGIADRLIFADQAEFIAHMAEKRKLPFRKRTIERLVFWIGWIELLGIWQYFDQCGSGVCAAMDFFDCVTALRIDRDACEKLMPVSLGSFEHIVVVDEKISVSLIEVAIPVVDSVHTEQHGLLNMTGGAEFGEEIIQILLVCFPWV